MNTSANTVLIMACAQESITPRRMSIHPHAAQAPIFALVHGPCAGGALDLHATVRS